MLNARNKCVSTTWLVATLLFLALALFQSTWLINAYLEHSSVTYVHDGNGMTLSHATTQRYASVLAALTFCNLQAVPSEQTHPSSRLWTYTAYKDFVRQRLDAESATSDERSLWGFYLSPTGYYRNVPVRNLTDIGYKLDHFLIKCQYILLQGLATKAHPCSELAEISIFTTPEYFNCFTLEVNSSRIPDQAIVLSISGLLYLDSVDDAMHDIPSFEMTPASVASTGALVSFHSPGEYPDIAHVSNMPPGFESIIQTEQTLYHK